MSKSNEFRVRHGLISYGDVTPDASGSHYIGLATSAFASGYFDTLEAGTSMYAKTYYGDGSNLAGVVTGAGGWDGQDNLAIANGVKLTGGYLHIGNAGTVNFADGNGDLYIEDELELGGDIATDRWLSQDSNTFIGIGVVGAGNLEHTTGEEGYRNTYIGYQAGYSSTKAATSVCIGYKAGYALTEGARNFFLGQLTGGATTTASNCVYIGHEAGFTSTTGGENVGIGTYAGYSNLEGNSNISIGLNAGYYNKGSQNIFMGRNAGYSTGYTADGNTRNVMIGYAAGFGNYENSSDNVFLGFESGNDVTTGNQNTLLGSYAGDNLTTGSNNIIIGYNIDTSAVGASNEINIGDTIYGDIGTGKVGIGIVSPTTELDVDGTIQATDYNTILMNANASGILQNISTESITASGNITITGTVDGIDIATDVAANTTHRGDNSQAHSDYLLNTGDTIAGDLTPDASGSRNIGTEATAFASGVFDNFEITDSFKLPLASPVAPAPSGVGEVELDMVDGTFVIRNSASHTYLTASTDVVYGKILHSKSITILEPDEVQAVTDAVPMFTVEADEFPHGIEIVQVYLKTSESSSFSIVLEKWATPTDGSPDTLTTIATSTSTEANEAPDTEGTVGTSEIIMLDLPDADNDINWMQLTIVFYEPIA